MEALVDALHEHQDAVREWHRTIGPAPSCRAQDDEGAVAGDGGGAGGDDA